MDIHDQGEQQRIFVGDSTAYIDDHNIVHITAIGDTDDASAQQIRSVALGYMEGLEGPVDCIIDMNTAGKPSSKARKIFKELSDHHRINKVALFGIHPVAEVLASFMIGISRRRNIRFFRSKDEAMDWLGARIK